LHLQRSHIRGVDAFIVQDQVFAYNKNLLPDVSLHASTQMTVYNTEGAMQLAKNGFERVVIARELTCDEIGEICANSAIEIEAFVHCIVRMLFWAVPDGSIIGQRSGNRGVVSNHADYT
jgi:putative protease